MIELLQVIPNLVNCELQILWSSESDCGSSLEGWNQDPAMQDKIIPDGDRIFGMRWCQIM